MEKKRWKEDYFFVLFYFIVNFCLPLLGYYFRRNHYFLLIFVIYDVSYYERFNNISELKKIISRDYGSWWKRKSLLILIYPRVCIKVHLQNTFAIQYYCTMISAKTHLPDTLRLQKLLHFQLGMYYIDYWTTYVTIDHSHEKLIKMKYVPFQNIYTVLCISFLSHKKWFFTNVYQIVVWCQPTN